jgi:hypothetical protein
VLRKILGPKKEKITEGWTQLHNEVLHNLYSSNIFRVMKSRKAQCVVCVAPVGKLKNSYKISFGKRKDGEDMYCFHVVQDRVQYRGLLNMLKRHFNFHEITENLFD